MIQIASTSKSKLGILRLWCFRWGGFGEWAIITPLGGIQHTQFDFDTCMPRNVWGVFFLGRLRLETGRNTAWVFSKMFRGAIDATT